MGRKVQGEKGGRALRKITFILRWVSVLPAAVAAWWLAWIVVEVGTTWGLSRATLPPDHIFVSIFRATAGSAMPTAALIYAGAIIAPSRRIAVVKVLAILCIMAGGFALAASVLQQMWWAAVSSVFAVIAAGYIVFKPELLIE